MSAQSMPRRGVLAAAAAALLAVPAGAVAMESNPDAELIAVHRSFRAAVRQEAAFGEAPSYPFGSPENEAKEKRLGDAILTQNEAVKASATLPARTLAGIRAKADLVAAALPKGLESFQLDENSPEIKLVMSLVNDLLRLSGEVA